MKRKQEREHIRNQIAIEQAETDKRIAIIKAEKEAELDSILEKYGCAWETEDPIPDEYPDVPVQLKNNRITDALNMVTNM